MHTTYVASAIAAAVLVAAPLANAQEFEFPKPPPLEISADFPFESKFVEVNGADLHYVEIGTGTPILFLHGNPTSSYLWRNILPWVEDHGRVIAVDNVGFGKSDKPDIGYTFAEHAEYLAGFIAALDLQDIVLVGHDWGGALAFDYAANNETNVRAMAFMETMLPPAMPVPSYEAMGPIADFFRTVRETEDGRTFIIEQNGFVESVLPGAVVRDLTPAEMDAYRAPFVDVADRDPVFVWPNQIPIAGQPADVTARVAAYSQWLTETDLPKLHVTVTPGALNPPPVVAWLTANLTNYETAYVGVGTHFIQEDHPALIGAAIADWVRRLPQ